MTDTTSAGAALRDTRISWNLGVRETARRAGISPGYLRDLESGRRRLRAKMAAQITRAIVGAS